MRVYLPRFHSSSLDINLLRLRADAAEAAAEGCELALFPEVFLTGYRLQADPALLREHFAEISSDHPKLLFAFGSITEDGYNRMPLYLAGREVAHYDKVHLFYPAGEGELWKVGERYVAYRHGDRTMGLVICNDIRFSEQAFALRQRAAVNMLLVPALWPWQRDYAWSALLRARAIEGGCFVLGCCTAGVDNGHEFFDGAGNHVFDPLGSEVYPKGRVYELDETVFARLTVNTREQYRQIDRVELIEGQAQSRAD